jgi:iron only hydrogenase large subunit-like protein
VGKFNSVRLDPEKCMGCIHCIKRCPTQAIRVRDRKAYIISDFCIDCGECIRICPHHAKQPVYDPLSVLQDFEYTVALPAPTLYAQFNNLEDTNIILGALLKMGFDDVYEVSAGAEIVSDISRKFIADHPEGKPYISTACPSIVRLVRVRFPNLIDNLLPISSPMDVAAIYARKRAVEKTGLPPEKIGIIFISPCPAKMTSVKAPIGIAKSEVDAVVAIKDIYPMLLPHMKDYAEADEGEIAESGKIGISWGKSGGEASGLLTDNYLAADGIENVIQVLEDLEDEKISHLDFIELNACPGGCVGGTLTVENPYVARAKLNRLRKYMPVSRSHADEMKEASKFYITEKIEYLPVFRIGTDIKDSINKMAQIDAIQKRFPALDCGACGAPTCKALAEDVVMGRANENDCIHFLKGYIGKLAKQTTEARIQSTDYDDLLN